MTAAATLWAFDLYDVSPLAKLIAIYAGDWGECGSVVRIPLRQMSEFCCCGPDLVRDALMELKEKIDLDFVLNEESVIEIAIP